MADYRLYGAETSPYSEKVRAALRYKGVEFDWVSRSVATEADFRALAPVPTVPLLISPGAVARQDSTAMLASLEADHPEPATIPDDPACAALALILEDYGDEWLNKAMFNARWGQSPDREVAAQRLLEQLFAGNPPASRAEEVEKIADRMSGRLPLVGAGGSNGEILQKSFQRFTELLNTHLKETLFIFGGRPSAADFSLAAQYKQMLGDPTPGEWLKDRAPFVVEWCAFMDDPKPGAPFKPLAELEETLLPLFKEEVAKTYLVWAAANSENASKRRKKLKVKIERKSFDQDTQKYAAKAFKSVKKAIDKMKAGDSLTAFFKAAGITQF
ncbi:MAG: glutathione S-transferase family protein [Hyphomonadaceae bacterium]|nr:glutathione S-transferase family protein [Hyphomonadaceae bacterium]